MTQLQSFEFLIGLTVTEAKIALEPIEHFKFTYLRIVRKDDLPMIITCDYVKDRLNVHIVNDKITEIIGFG